MERKYLPTLAELIDRLAISQLKENFLSDHKEEYAQEINDILHDINIMIKDSKLRQRQLELLSYYHK